MKDDKREKQEKEILDDILSRKENRIDAAMEKLQSLFWVKMAAKAVLGCGGTNQEADDIFTESVVDMVLNILKGKFKGKSRLSTYFYRICRNKAIVMMEAKMKLAMTTIDDAQFVETKDESEEIWIGQEERMHRTNLINELLDLVGHPCNKIIVFDSMDYQYDEIALEIGFKTANSVKSKIYNCRKAMRAILASNPLRYKILRP